MAIRVLGVCGSMRVESYSGGTVRLALEAAREHGAETRLLDLREIKLPTYNPDEKAPEHEGLKTATDAVNWADAFFSPRPTTTARCRAR